MKKILLLIGHLLLVSQVKGEESWQGIERQNQLSQVKLWNENYDKSKEFTGREKVEFLALGLTNMAYHKTRENHSPLVEELFTKIQLEILATAGHATYFRDKIVHAQENLETVWSDSTERGVAFSLVARERMNGFRTLTQMPSVETINVLGEFLFNTWVPPENASQRIEERLQPLSERAATTLMKLPIANKPAGLTSAIASDTLEINLAVWQRWYEQVKSGTLTFSFVGDPTEYDLNGPAPKEKLQRIAHDQQRDEGRLAGHKKAAAGTELAVATSQIRKPFHFAGILAACSIIAIAVWYFLRNYGLKKNQ
jgi:hypothetical protein